MIRRSLPLFSEMVSIPRLFAQYAEQHPDESDALERFRTFLDRNPDPVDHIDRVNFQGHVTASGFVLSADGSATLLVFHRRLGIYVQPGGHLDPSDASPLDGALREVREETGIEYLRYVAAFKDAAIPFDIDTHHIPANETRGEPEHWHHDFRYAFLCRDDAALTLAVDEVSDARWVPLRELHGYPTLERVGNKLLNG